MHAARNMKLHSYCKISSQFFQQLKDYPDLSPQYLKVVLSFKLKKKKKNISVLPQFRKHKVIIGPKAQQ